jgi:hypothetical protein
MTSVEEADYWELNEPFVSPVYRIRHYRDVAEGVDVMEVEDSKGCETAETIEPGSRENPRRWERVVEGIRSDELRCECVAQSGHKTSNPCYGGP